MLSTKDRGVGARRPGLVVAAVATIACLAPAALAQPDADPVAEFFSLLEANTSLDDARLIVATKFGDPAVATDIAVHLCTPPALEACRNSQVFAAFVQFQKSIEQGAQAADAAMALASALEDPYLAYGIALYWCSPEPLAGCKDDPFQQVWTVFYSMLAEDPNPARALLGLSAEGVDSVATEMIAASECGESTCYAAVLKDVDFGPGAGSAAPPKPASKPALQYGFVPTKKTKEADDLVCQAPGARSLVDSCK